MSEVQIMEMQQISELTKGELVGDGSAKVKYIATDSRSLPGKDFVLFLAMKGPHHDGNKYIKHVFGQGVKLFLTDQHPPKDEFPGASFCIVENTLAAFQMIAAERRKRFEGTLISIAGSNGKTIVKEWLYETLQSEYNVVRSPRSYNSQLGVPLSLWQISNNYDIAIIEAGISMPGEMKQLQKIIQPDIGIFTNIGPAHSENFTSESQKSVEKLLLFKDCKKLIYRSDLNIEGNKIETYLQDIKAELVGWSIGGDAKYTYNISSQSDNESNVELIHKEEKTYYQIPFLDDASIENLLHVITALCELGKSPAEINSSIGQLKPIEMRLETLKGIFSSTLVNDVYNSDLAGLNVALDVLMQQNQHQKKVVILSDVYQSGMEERTLYKEVSDLLKFRKVDAVYCVGENISKNENLFPQGSKFFSLTESFIKNFDPREIENSAVLIKGARKFHFETITRMLQLQLHQTVLEINVNNLIYNLNYYRSLIRPETKIMIMVKALSYGTGAHEIAGFLQHEKVDYLAVAFPDEGVRLRQAGISLPILVMNAAVSDFRLMLENQLEPEIFSKSGLLGFIDECRYSGLSNQAIHLKLDTGMHRLGFEVSDLEWLKKHLFASELKIASIFSHLVGSDNEDLDDFSNIQFEQFIKFAKDLEKNSREKSMLHILNSAGIERFPDYQLDMVRIGIGLYGQGISKNLLPVSTYKTSISQIRKVAKGDTIGYNRKGKVKIDSVIATIPVGYADGIDRRLGNGSYSFHINGSFAPTIGNICMDMTMIDITGIKATLGDQVELFGKHCLLSNMANTLDTIVYEVITSIPERVKRVYIRE